MSDGMNLDLEMLKAWLQSGDPAAIEELTKLGVIEDQASLAGNQLKQAQALRAFPTPGGTYTRGGTYTASSPLEHIGAAANRIMGGVAEGIAMKKLGSLVEDKKKGRGSFLSKLLKAYEDRNRPASEGPISAPKLDEEDPYFTVT